MKFNFLLLIFLCSNPVFSQLGFCPGSKGDAIFHEDFGSGTSSGPQLPAGITTYKYVIGDPQDGEYTISDQISQNIGSWHSFLPKTTVSNGRALIVNASYTSGQFYRTEIQNLCENTTYEFSAFLMNIYDRTSLVCLDIDGGIPINVRFQIWDETDTVLLKEGNTGDISSTNSPVYKQYALTFQTEPGQGSVILKMFNNGIGGCGNDLAIDDIIFRSCGDLTKITSQGNDDPGIVVCEPDAPLSLTLTAIPDFSVYTQHAFQWQESSDNVDWQDIPGETNSDFTSPPLNSSRYYRVKVAEAAVNLINNLCSSASQAYFVNIVKTPEAPLSNGDTVICSDDVIPALSVQVEAGETVNWYDTEVGGNQIAAGTVTFTPDHQGSFYAEAVKVGFNCAGSIRTSVSLTINETPQVQNEVLQLCENGKMHLDAGVENMEYKWSTGEFSREIIISEQGNFSVVITTNAGCSVTKNFEIHAVDVAGIEAIISEENTVIIKPANTGEFEYSLDGVTFQLSNTFQLVPGGVYIAFMRDLQSCNTVSEEFPHIVVPKFITPNNDGYNDRFELKGVEYFTSSSIRIFNRYGKLLIAGKGQNFSWDGTFNDKDLPGTDYWYEINIEDYKRIKGHFSLKR
ncbi:MAG: T9SS type B sorting domain-containing protein [Flavobacteriaceae bacterium]|nr:T9SS type B sorting domain-containing protein [Flavobacteriaceae bacterium]